MLWAGACQVHHGYVFPGEGGECLGWCPEKVVAVEPRFEMNLNTLNLLMNIRDHAQKMEEEGEVFHTRRSLTACAREVPRSLPGGPDSFSHHHLHHTCISGSRDRVAHTMPPMTVMVQQLRLTMGHPCARFLRGGMSTATRRKTDISSVPRNERMPTRKIDD